MGMLTPMIVVLSSVLVALAYLGCVPICFAMSLRFKDGLSGFVGIGVFGRPFARVWTAESLYWPEPQTGWRAPPIEMRRALKQFFGDLTVERLSLRVGTPNACATALLCGGLQSIGLAARVPICVTANFQATEPVVTVLGIVSVRVGHIMRTALWCAMISINRRRKEWIKARFKG